MQSKTWYFLRFRNLIKDGFSPEEASVIANVRLSTRPIRILRMKRRYNVAHNIPISEEEKIISWETFRKILYPQKHKSI